MLVPPVPAPAGGVVPVWAGGLVVVPVPVPAVPPPPPVPPPVPVPVPVPLAEGGAVGVCGAGGALAPPSGTGAGLVGMTGPGVVVVVWSAGGLGGSPLRSRSLALRSSAMALAATMKSCQIRAG